MGGPHFRKKQKKQKKQKKINKMLNTHKGILSSQIDKYEIRFNFNCLQTIITKFNVQDT